MKMRINIIGGGLAGCALAYVLKKRGMEPVIYEASSDLASGASGNEVGLYNPRFTAQLDEAGIFYTAAFREVLDVFGQAGKDIECDPCGTLHLMDIERKQKRYPKTVQSWQWPKDDMYIVNAQEASDIAGVELIHDCLYIEKSGKVSPRKLCAYYARGVEVHLNASIDNLTLLQGEVNILACGMGVLKFEVAAGLPLMAVRGQVSYIQASAYSSLLKVALCYGGYIAPADNGVHCIGATFQRWLEHCNCLEEDDLANIEKMIEAIPSLETPYDVMKSRASVRTSSKDYFPVVGQFLDGIYISTAHGSHGILSSLLSAVILSDMVTGVDNTMPSSVLNALSPLRFS